MQHMPCKMQRIASNMHHTAACHHAHPAGCGTAAVHCRRCGYSIRSLAPLDSLRVRTRRYARQMREEELVFIGMQVPSCCGRRPHPFVGLFARVGRFAIRVRVGVAVRRYGQCETVARRTAPRRTVKPHWQESEKKASAPDPIAKAEENRAYRKLLQVRTPQYPVAGTLQYPAAGARYPTHGLLHDGSARGWAAGAVA